ncbi:MAG: D-sedoheptulose 7-phosphate isomerase [Candidatus Cloacimonetes bacterium]|nr:D-sedoheptulose 7-phosphate isomerase [Candidatus Cloacimonadota bacterium]MDD3142660.1 D-sedoheptulose 7-phosphate isomerase [Candidatus Cloacimonadota bacterium]MDY0368038.1 D-sedoheptulose 7-phosphate isomerase [Candidatus Syntrophosphaera sp.]
MRELIQASCTAAGRNLKAFLAEAGNFAAIENAARLIAQGFARGGKVIAFGNGGSMCDAMHFAEELTGRFRRDRKALPAIALSDPSHLTCVGNDYGFEQVFARGVEAYAAAGDVVLGLSTSGNSPNVIRGLATARELGCHTIALLGKDGGQLAGTCELQIIVPGEHSDRIQELHTLILHIIIECVERLLFGDVASGDKNP